MFVPVTAKEAGDVVARWGHMREGGAETIPHPIPQQTNHTHTHTHTLETQRASLAKRARMHEVYVWMKRKFWQVTTTK